MSPGPAGQHGSSASWDVAEAMLEIDGLADVMRDPAAARADLAGGRLRPRRLFSAAEVISRAADRCCEPAQLVHDDERRRRVTHQRIDDVLQALTARSEG